MRGVDRETARQIEARRHNHHPEKNEHQRFHITSEHPGNGRKDALYHADGQKDTAGHYSRIAQSFLHIKRQEIGPPEHPDPENEQRDHRHTEMKVFQQPDIQQRMFLPPFSRYENRKGDGRHYETTDNHGR